MNDYELLGIEEDPGYSGVRVDNREGLQKALEQAFEQKTALVAYIPSQDYHVASKIRFLLLRNWKKQELISSLFQKI